MKVIVGSKNPVKIKAIEIAFAKIFPDHKFEFIGFGAKSGVPDQPFGLEETLTGALNRAKLCSKEYPDADYYCGLESGLVKDVDSGEMATAAWVAIRDKQQNLGKGLSSMHFIPPKVAQLVSEGYELGDADDIVFQQTNSKQSHGSIGLLTNNAYTRTDKLVEAAMCALLPHKNPGLYF